MTQTIAKAVVVVLDEGCRRAGGGKPESQQGGGCLSLNEKEYR